MHQYKSSQSGFTLVEIALVMLIGSVVIAVGASMLITYMHEKQMMTTQSRMQDIGTALTQYLNVNGALPCPASLTIAQDTITFGMQSGAGAGCIVVAGTWQMAPKPIAAGCIGAADKAFIGAVPVRSLGLPDQDIADAWGDRFAYAVTGNLTISSPVSKYDPTCGSIVVVDSGPNPIAPTGGAPTVADPAAQYVIISYGADRAGAYTLAGVKSAVTCPAFPVAKETANCTLLKNNGIQQFTKSILYSNQTGANMYDDYVTFQAQPPSTGTVPSGMVAPFPNPPNTKCPAGWLTAAGACLGSFICCQKQ